MGQAIKKRNRIASENEIVKALQVFERCQRLFVGIELHKDVRQIEVQASRGAVLVNRAFSTSWDTAREVVSQLSGCVKAVAIKASGY